MTDSGAATMGGKPPEPPKRLDFDTWARLAARLATRGDGERAEILAAERVDPAIYRDSNAHWGAILDADLAAGRSRRPERYAAACADALERRRALVARPPAPAPAPAPVPTPDAPQAKVVEVEVPSFLREDLSRPRLALASPPLEPPSPASARPSPSRPPTAGETVDVNAILSAPPLPFRAGGSTPPPPPEAPGPALSRPPTAGETVDVGAVFAGAAVPFVKAPAASPPPSHPSMRRPPTVEPAHEEVSIGGFTLHQYASLCAELAVYANQTAAVLVRYGLGTEQRRRQLASLWEAHILADPALCRAWTNLTAQYREWLLHHPRQG